MKLSEQMWVCPFGGKQPIAPLDPKLLGGKGKGLVEMCSLGLPVPPGFILTTEACNAFRKNHHEFSDGFEDLIRQAVKQLELTTGRTFGKELLLSVRSGARASMPGMMDTVLNLGLNKKGLNDAHSFDCYRRLISSFASIVSKLNRSLFDEAWHLLKLQENVVDDADVSFKTLQRGVELFEKIYFEKTGTEFPQNPYEQLFMAVKAVFNSWDGERARLYRQLQHIPDEWGTACTVQMMVFGNKNEKSATGVGFTRDPVTGNRAFYGEFLLNAQGEEVVAGVRTPHPINKAQKKLNQSTLLSLEELLPDVYKELELHIFALEKHFRDMQDIEFTIEDNKLYMLQTRTGKRTGFASVKMAIDMLDEGLINEEEALLRVQPEQLTQLLAPVFKEKEKNEKRKFLVGKGIHAGPGAASGVLALTASQAVAFSKKGVRCLLVRKEANPEDFPGMVASEGILTLRGGSTSHAAVVARGMGKPCVVGCGDLTINESNKTLSAKGLTIKEGEPISIDGTTGEVFFCDLKTSPSEIMMSLLEGRLLENSAYQRLLNLAEKRRILKVRANADSPRDALVARALGAEGIGLCRTEHMFMEPNRLSDVRRLFFSQNGAEKEGAINRLLPHQREDFVGLFQVMKGLPVTIRLLDPPLHEFMPTTQDELQELALSMGTTIDHLKNLKTQLEEHNPMLGARGCRLGVTIPELTKMQVRAIFEAACQVAKEGHIVHVEIMIPLVSVINEVKHQKALIEQTAEEVFRKENYSIPYSIGTMIELPRAVLIAGQIAEEVDFFSFGTNDLTQTLFGISRDDSAKFVPLYIRGVPSPLDEGELMHIFNEDPFQTIDVEGVGEMMKMGVERGRRSKPSLCCGICGEHGGDPKSIYFCSQVGLNYVSCSPYRVPIAKLSAAQAAILEKKQK